MGKDPKELAEKVRKLSGDAMGQLIKQHPQTPYCLQEILREMEEIGVTEVMKQKNTPAGN